MATTFSNKVAILSKINSEYRESDLLAEFFRYNDLGLPFAQSVFDGKEATQEMIDSIEETFDSLMELAQKTDTGFETLDEVFA